jgi:hypothetical protein
LLKESKFQRGQAQNIVAKINDKISDLKKGIDSIQGMDLGQFFCGSMKGGPHGGRGSRVTGQVNMMQVADDYNERNLYLRSSQSLRDSDSGGSEVGFHIRGYSREEFFVRGNESREMDVRDLEVDFDF